MKKKNQTSAANRYLLLGLSLFCILMMVLSSFSDKVSGPFKVFANYTVIPLQQGINQIGGWLGDMSDNFETLQQLRTENEKLQEQIDTLTTENSNLQENAMSSRDFVSCTSSIRTTATMRRLLLM